MEVLGVMFAFAAMSLCIGYWLGYRDKKKAQSATNRSSVKKNHYAQIITERKRFNK